MQFQVPQFIEVEDKIFGPLTFKQFVYVAGGAGLAYLMWRVFPIYLAAPLVGGALGLGAALAFFQYNGRPFIVAIEHAFYYLTRSKLYLWKDERRNKNLIARAAQDEKKPLPVFVPKLSESKLHELAWSLDIKERIAAGVASDDEREDFTPRSRIVAPIRTARGALVQ
ncbi:PrgI family protein [Candidatus Kaiserbacteria bacterium]|nr:PrgI family protein [Candidatus Kaiserbacteria bacterium]